MVDLHKWICYTIYINSKVSFMGVNDMGSVDISMKEFLKINEIFAQLFSVGLFHDKGKIHAEDLIELDSVENATVELRNGQTESIERLRDVTKLSREGFGLQIILAVEQQTEVHYYMPVRCMQYDALAYDKQCKAIAATARERKDKFSYAQGVPKGTKIMPVISLVFYIGMNEWDGPRELFDMFEIKDENREWVKKYIHNYGMHLIDARHMKVEDIEYFEGDLRAFLLMLKDSYSAEQMENIVAKHRETWYALSEIKNDKRYKEYIDRVPDELLKEGISMCATLDYYETKGRNAGVEQMIMNMYKEGCSLELISRVAHQGVEEIQKIIEQNHKEE